MRCVITRPTWRSASMRPIPPGDRACVWLVCAGWNHINLLGRYQFSKERQWSDGKNVLSARFCSVDVKTLGQKVVQSACLRLGYWVISGGAMESDTSFGLWLRRRRKALDLTQDALAARVGCSVATIRKIEADERRPSHQIAEILAQ